MAVAVRLDTAYLPPVTFETGGGGSAGGAGVLVRALKPAVTVTVNGERLYHLAPAGEPGPSRWPWVLAGLVLLVLVLVLVLRRLR